jgi:hypothetical protein
MVLKLWQVNLVKILNYLQPILFSSLQLFEGFFIACRTLQKFQHKDELHH